MMMYVTMKNEFGCQHLYKDFFAGVRVEKEGGVKLFVAIVRYVTANDIATTTQNAHRNSTESRQIFEN